jgi:DNA repair protein SbcD/Mre11
MRFLHTSDWHLGRSLHRAGLLDAQGAFLDHLVATVRSERVDAVLIAGDVYDRAVPSADALALCEDGLIRLRAVGTRVVAISGNHDSARRLGFGSRLFDASGVHLRTRAAKLAEPVLLDDSHGTVAVYGVPYLEPSAVRAELPMLASGHRGSGQGDVKDRDDGRRTHDCGGDGYGGDGVSSNGLSSAGHGDTVPVDDHRGVLDHAAACIRGDIAARGVARSVVLAHAWVAGGSSSDSERDISVGGVRNVPSGIFRGFTYVALGHLHGQQTIEDNLRYSGSPLPYSFSEAAHRKGSWLIELDTAGPARVEHVPAPSTRRLTVLRGLIDELLTSTAFSDHERDFVSVTLTDASRPEGAMERLRARFPHVLVLSFEPGDARGDRHSYRARVAGRGDLDIAAGFVEHVRRAPSTDGERALLTAAFQAARLGADDDAAASTAAAGTAGTAMIADADDVPGAAVVAG